MEQIYHVVNRGVDKRIIFNDDQDYLRFIHNLFEFNDENPALNMWYAVKTRNSDIVNHYNNKKTRELLVDILAFCLMPNHYHLLIAPRKEKALSVFMKKIGIGYAKYFNNKYERTGTLFERRYKSVLVQKHAHFLYVPFYIHLNPLDLIMPGWRQGKIDDTKKAIGFLKNYRWSSFPDYIGKKNFPSVTSRKLLNEYFEKPDQHNIDMINWIRERDEYDAYFE